MNTATELTKFEPVPNWGRLPTGVTFRNSATSVAVDSADNVYVFNRGTEPIAVFDTDGNFVRGFGHSEFVRPHGIEIDADDNLYLVDRYGHFVQKRTNDGELVFTIGTKGKPCEWQSGGMFNNPTDIAIHPVTGELFVSDGYGNSRIHNFDPDGNHIKSWGESGTDPGQFSLPHNVCTLGTDKVVVADSMNFRLQVFTTEGEFVEQIHIHSPISVTQGKGGDEAVYVGELTAPPVMQGVSNLGAMIAVLSPELEFQQHLGGPLPGWEPGQFTFPHGMTTDSKGSIYVAEVAGSPQFSRPEYSGGYEPPLGELISLRKWIRV